MLVAAILLALPQNDFRRDFAADKTSLTSVGRNDYFVLEPGYQLVLDGKEDGAKVHLVIDVLDKTEIVDGVKTRIVREKEFHGGHVTEISMNYFAFDPRTKDVYYFGEHVDMFNSSHRVISNEGSWRSGSHGAHFGLVMPGSPKLHDRYFQEIADHVAMDRAENVSLTERLTTPAGVFRDCLKTEETTPLEPHAKEFKVYAPGVGLVQDGPLLLSSHGKAK